MDIKNFSWKYETSDDWILKDINLSIKKGEFIAITGASGAGKTTLCQSLNGLIPQSFNGIMKGEINVSGMNTLEHGVSELAEKVGLLFQDPESQFIGMTVEEDIVFGLENLGIERSEITQRLEWAVQAVKMEGYQDKAPGELSGGQKQRVAISSALVMLPEILVLDEPTSELDPMGKASVFQIISELRKQRDMTIILVEHETEEIAKFADRVFLVKNGEITLEGPPRDFFSNVKLLKQAGVDPPAVTELDYLITQKYQSATLPLITSEDMITKLKNLLGRKPPKKQLNSLHSNLKKTFRPFRKTNKIIIQVKDLKHTYADGTEALTDVSTEICEGEFVGIIGQNGSGKTTFVKHLNGLLRPTNGTISVAGLNTEQLSIAELSTRVGYVFQNPDHMLSQETVEKEVSFGLRNLGLANERVEEMTKQAIDTVGLTHLRERSPLMLGKGERQRVAFASILAMEPEVFVIDEPTTGQDHGQGRIMMDLIADLNAKGRTIIVISHDMRLIAEYTFRTIVFHDGKILLDGPTDSVFSEENMLKQTFIKPPQITQVANAMVEYGIPEGVLTVKDMMKIITKYQEYTRS